ncbi:MAG: hypothetical protein NXY57DRAFT_907658, partial [Lentinula lateritia]
DSIGERGDPCGVPLVTGSSSEIIPSTQTAALRSERKFFTNCTICSGIPLHRSSERRRSWFTKSKKPLMSKVSADVTMPRFHAA